jgi:hypothetical protein
MAGKTPMGTASENFSRQEGAIAELGAAAVDDA